MIIVGKRCLCSVTWSTTKKDISKEVKNMKFSANNLSYLNGITKCNIHGFEIGT